MLSQRHIFAWVILGLAALVLITVALPETYPLVPEDWQISRREATEIALEHLRQLGELPERPYVVTHLVTDTPLELDLLELRQRLPPDLAHGIAGTFLGRQVLIWEVLVYPPAAANAEWRFLARITPDGELRSLRRQGDPAAAKRGPSGAARLSPLAPSAVPPPLSTSEAQTLAATFLQRQGYDLTTLGESMVRVQQFYDRTDLTVMYTLPSPDLAADSAYPPHGLMVSFTGDRLTGFHSWYESGAAAETQRLLRASVLLTNGRWLSGLLLVPLVGIFFVRRYHAGEIGVRTGVQLMALVFGSSLLLLVFIARPASQGMAVELFSRLQSTWVWGTQMLVTFFFPVAVLCFLGWSVGESVCREHWSGKLAAFDAVLRGQWRNVTVARSVLRGSVLGLAAAGVLAAAAVAVPAGTWLPVTQVIWWFHQANWFGVSLLTSELVMVLYIVLFGQLLVVSATARRFGTVPAVLASALLYAAIFFPALQVVPVLPALLFGLLTGAALAIVFLRYDLLTTLLALLIVNLLFSVSPFLGAEDPWLRFQSTLPLALLALPVLLTARYLRSCDEFIYRYDDIPPHVRRIAERERQRIELETARGIQSSILPDLPPQLAGVELAHAYQPATEVGGDFYDVLALDDGRLAVAVGDVAGHGVSSGLIMSVAKSALAVQVTFDPEVEAVLCTLNRMVYQSARRRLLTTLCYGILDPERRELVFASAGHLFPYRVGNDGRIESLESVAYPLGVRPQVRPQVRKLHLDAGDNLVLYSDGIVEARAEGSDELFGFARLERTLAEAAGSGAAAVRDAVLHAVNEFIGYAPQEDDRTVLVLRLP